MLTLMLLHRPALLLPLLLVAACAGDTTPATTTAPGEPSKADDPRFAFAATPKTMIIGNALTAGDDTLELNIVAAVDASVVDVWIDRQFVQRSEGDGDRFDFAIDVSELGPGEHEILLAADGERFAFAQRFFERSHPLYVVVSNDWDDPDNADATLRRQEILHERHPELLLTHFVGPYTFTDPTLSPERVATLVDWVTGMRDTEGDEIGLHIHPYCHFVESAGVSCNTAPSFARQSDSTGYTVFLGSYDEDETVALLNTADELFTAHGLGKPTSFRAGGWTAEIHTMRALGRAGYVADSSACNWERLEEWQDNAGASLFAWNRENWAPINELSQPYYPNTGDILADLEPQVPVLEVPDNGLLVDYVSAQEMIDMFEANLGNGVLTEPRVYSIGYHPPNFSENFLARMDGALTHIDQHLASSGDGPVVYARVSDIAQVFPAP